MNVVGRVGSLISQGVYSVATPFHPFGGAVDVIVVEQPDGTFRSTPWYVRFGKFQGVLKGAEKIVKIAVNGVEADFHMYLDNSGEAYFLKEVTPEEKESDSTEGAKIDSSNDKNGSLGGIERTISDSGRSFYDFEDGQSSLEDSPELSEYGSSRYDNLDVDHYVETQNLNSEVVLVSVDGHILTAPISTLERDIDESVQLSTPRFHLGPGQEAEFCEDNVDLSTGDEAWTDNYLNVLGTSSDSKNSCNEETDIKTQVQEDVKIIEQERETGSETNFEVSSMTKKDDIFKSCLDIPLLANHDKNSPKESAENADQSQSESAPSVQPANENGNVDTSVSPCKEAEPIGEITSVARVDSENFSENSGEQGKKAEDGHIGERAIEQLKTEVEEKVDDTLAVEQISLQGSEEKSCEIENLDPDNATSGDKAPTISVEKEKDSKTGDQSSELPLTPRGRTWRLWPIPFRSVKTIEHTSSGLSSDDVFTDAESLLRSQTMPTTLTSTSGNGNKQFLRINIPSTEQIASLNLKEGQNMVTFSFCTRILGMQQVDAHIYLWKWNARIVISDVDGTITKSDVLGQFMPLFGRDWTQSGVARLFSAIKENGYQLLFLSARAIVQAYLTKSFLCNIKQDGKALPNGPVVISPDGLFPSLYREVIRRAPHEFKIACLEDIKALFPPDYNPFYAGFGNRDTDKLSYRKVGIAEGKIFIINPKGEVAISQHRIDVKSYTSLHTLVNDMFPPTSMVEQEDFNSWNYWRMPLPDLD